MTEPFRPWTWKIPEGGAGGKRGLIRQDGYARASGKAAFTRDIYLPGMLYAKILTSPYAYAKIVNMDISEAKALTGVRDILTYNDSDIAEDNARGIEPAAASYTILTLPGISDFYQHPMGAVVVADSEEVCDRALKLIKVQWEERPFVLDMAESLKADAPKIMPEVKRHDPMAKEPNTVAAEEMEIGDVKKGFAEADKVIEYTINKAWNTPAGVEALSCVAQWQGDFLDLWVHHQVNPQGNLSGSVRGGRCYEPKRQDPGPSRTPFYGLVQNKPHFSLSGFAVRGTRHGSPTAPRLSVSLPCWRKERMATR